MPVDATTLLGVVKDAIEELYPAVPVKLLKRGVTSGRYPHGGRSPALAGTIFLVSCPDPEGVEEAATFEETTTRYWVLVEYCKPAFAAVPGGDPNTEMAEDSDVRDKRDALRNRFNRSSLGGVSLMNVKVRTRPAYEVAADDKRFVISGTMFGFLVWSDRP